MEHTGELLLRVSAADFGALLEEAARAVAGIMADDAGGPATGPTEHVELVGRDRESLLVDWLNELVYRADVNKLVYGDVRVDHADEHRVAATIRGRDPSSPRTAVKAATWHRLSVSRTADGLEATVVLDV